jgi:nucleotidyltransferase substrate binding protein (TIGR01987 family)
MNNIDIRWKQRFSNYQKALKQLEEFTSSKKLNALEEQGLIQAFEYTHELAWKTLADFLKYQGNSEIYGSKDATREAFNLGLIDNGEIWMSMIQSRNMTSHTYNKETAKQIVSAIFDQYLDSFLTLQTKLKALL